MAFSPFNICHPHAVRHAEEKRRKGEKEKKTS
jgi:hypothetical protein